MSRSLRDAAFRLRQIPISGGKKAVPADGQMIRRVRLHCEFDGCTTKPSYGIAGGRPTHCKTHADAEMIDVISKRCVFDGCTTLSSFVGGGRHYCIKHAVELGHRPGPYHDGASAIACEFYNCLGRETQGRLAFAHARTLDSKGEPMGEVRGLVHPKWDRPDGIHAWVAKNEREDEADFMVDSMSASSTVTTSMVGHQVTRSTSKLSFLREGKHLKSSAN